MEPPTNSNLEAIATRAIEKGFVDGDAVSSLTEHYDAHAVICEDKANLLFAINTAVRSNDQNCPEWQQLFAQAICRFVVFDLNSPGEIAEDESKWLLQHLGKTQELSVAEVSLLKEIHSNAVTLTAEVRELVDRVRLSEAS